MTNRPPDVAGVSCEFFRYSVHLDPSIRVGCMEISTKVGFLVRCRMEGFEGWGDSCPLDGYSRETSEATAAVLTDCRRHIQEYGVLPPDAPASVRTGWMLARGQAEAARSGITMENHHGSGGQVDAVLVARLIQDAENLEDAQVALQAAWRDGYRTFKFKVGRRSVSDDLERLHILLQTLPAAARIRLDANRAWSLADAVRFVKAFPSERVDFLEEPLRDRSDESAFHEAVDFPVAWDESLLDRDPGMTAVSGHPSALILKPTLLGLDVCLAWREWARAREVPVVVSSMYESGVGLFHLRALAAAWAPGIPAGLDTYSFVRDDILKPRWVVREAALPTFSHQDLWGRLNVSALEPVS
ncbi:MAG TPA: o-succinylbenzoate synthase [Kiritimatiellia bacterium]|nr:o-succinylbenzoate synthase [Kiritimatiellia bacterium]HMP00223.1 o-succinylbenzoate synthase [Kiritimatiellia bacterium]